MLTVSRHTKGTEQSESRALNLPEMLLDKVIDYNMNSFITRKRRLQ